MLVVVASQKNSLFLQYGKSINLISVFSQCFFLKLACFQPERNLRKALKQASLPFEYER